MGVPPVPETRATSDGASPRFDCLQYPLDAASDLLLFALEGGPPVAVVALRQLDDLLSGRESGHAPR